MIFSLAAGCVALVLGSHFLVSGSATVARRLKVSDVFIGVVLVGFATSLPELLASYIAVASGMVDLGVANVVGSNIVNILLILCISSLVHALPIRDKTVFKMNAFAMIAAAAIFTVVSYYGKVNRFSAEVMLLAIVVYIYCHLS